ncbi:hypothetical protein LSAT2_021666 [Lamellibrachia satsuma]|nr:hypothetical protein LSAT2_021666 [Lamellibrachia satsuma]
MELFSGLISYYGYETKNQTEMFCGDQRLNNSEFLQKRYCGNNFNSIAHSFVILFELLVVNQWHVLSSGFVLVTSKAARLYFISFHMICVVILLNILTAFILEVFILEYSLAQTELESAIEARIKDMGLGLGQNPGANPKTAKQDKHVLVDNMEEVEMSQNEAPSNMATTAASSANGASASPGLNEQDQGLRFRLKRSSHKRVETLLEYMFEGEIEPAYDAQNEEVTTTGGSSSINASTDIVA